MLPGNVLLLESKPVPDDSAVVGTSAVGSAELEAGVSVAVSPPPQAAAAKATAKTADKSHICDLRRWISLSYCGNIAVPISPNFATSSRLAFSANPVIVNLH